MSFREKLEQIEEQVESDNYRELQADTRNAWERESVRIDGVLFIRRKQTKVYVKRVCEKRAPSRLEQDLAADSYWEYLMRAGL